MPQKRPPAKYLMIWGIPLALCLIWFIYWEFTHLGEPGDDLFSNLVWWIKTWHWTVRWGFNIFFTWLWIHFVTDGKVDKAFFRFVGRLFRKEQKHGT